MSFFILVRIIVAEILASAYILKTIVPLTFGTAAMLSFHWQAATAHALITTTTTTRYNHGLSAFHIGSFMVITKTKIEITAIHLFEREKNLGVPKTIKITIC